MRGPQVLICALGVLLWIVLSVTGSERVVEDTPAELRADLTGSSPVEVGWLLDGALLGYGNPLSWVFADPGLYRLEAVARNTYGDDREGLWLEVEASGVVELRPSSRVVAIGEPVGFEAVLGEFVVWVYEYDWTNDGRIDAQRFDPVTSHTYPAAGEYRARLVVTGPSGTRSAVSDPVQVLPSGSLVFADGFEEGLWSD